VRAIYIVHLKLGNIVHLSLEGTLVREWVLEEITFSFRMENSRAASWRSRWWFVIDNHGGGKEKVRL